MVPNVEPISVNSAGALDNDAAGCAHRGATCIRTFVHSSSVAAAEAGRGAETVGEAAENFVGCVRAAPAAALDTFWKAEDMQSDFL
jgi:hypothetical protein